MTPLTRLAGECVRPRVEGARENEILDACVCLLLEVGYDRLTMDAVAGRAKASKATLYRRWSSKPALVVDALLRSKKAPDMLDVDTGSLRGDLLATFCGPTGLEMQHSTELFASLVTALHTDPEFAAEFRERWLAPKMAVTQQVYARAAARGDLLPTADPGLLGPALAGILLHRYFVMGEVIDTPTVEAVLDQIILPAATGRATTSVRSTT